MNKTGRVRGRGNSERLMREIGEKGIDGARWGGPQRSELGNDVREMAGAC